MLSSERIRDVCGVLPWLCSASETLGETEPDGSIELVFDLAEGAPGEAVGGPFDQLYTAIHLIGGKLAAEFKATDPEELTDPDGEGAAALEAVESYLRDRIEKLGGMADHLDSRQRAKADQLSSLFAKLLTSFQEIRWALLVRDGLRASPGDREFTSGSEWIASVDTC